MADKKMRYIAMRQAGEPKAPEGKEDGAPEGEKKANDGTNSFSRQNKEKDEIWVRKEYLLFDLDGTLTDPKLGITSCVQYALKSFGIDEPDLDKLEPLSDRP